MIRFRLNIPSQNITEYYSVFLTVSHSEAHLPTCIFFCVCVCDANFKHLVKMLSSFFRVWQKISPLQLISSLWGDTFETVQLLCSSSNICLSVSLFIIHRMILSEPILTMMIANDFPFQFTVLLECLDSGLATTKVPDVWFTGKSYVSMHQSLLRPLRFQAPQILIHWSHT